MHYSNNSVVTMSDIGFNRDSALYCFTNVTTCCRGLDGGVGPSQWYYPDNGTVPGRNINQVFYRARGPKSVLLHLRENVSEPMGIFRCEIVNVSIYFGIYPENAGKKKLLLFFQGKVSI